VTGSWTRYTVSGVGPTGTGYVSIGLRGGQTPANSNTADILVWGAQLELGSTASAYTKNVGGFFPPRFDYNPATLAPRGLLIEEQRTNLLLQSQTFDNASWTKSVSTVTANAATAPDGTTTAEKSIVNNGITLGSSTGAGLRQDITKAASNITYTFSTFAKAAEFNSVQIFMANLAANAAARCQFNLAAGTAATPVISGVGFSSASATITDFGNGWYRCILTATSDADTAMRNTIMPADTVATQGNGTSGILVWGAQLEAGAFATSYIPTVASTVTRAADIATIVAPMFAPWYNQSAGTFVVEADKLSATGFGYVLLANDGTSNQRFGMYQSNTAVAGFISAAGATQMEISSSPIVANTPFKAAVAAIANNGNFSFNGGIGVTDPSLAMPTPNRLDIGSFASGLQLNGHLRSINYYPLRLTNAQLQGLTT